MRGDEWIYVGQATSLPRRIEEHRREGKFAPYVDPKKCDTPCTIDFCVWEHKSDMAYAEAVLIKVHKPLLNTLCKNDTPFPFFESSDLKWFRYENGVEIDKARPVQTHNSEKRALIISYMSKTLCEKEEHISYLEDTIEKLRSQCSMERERTMRFLKLLEDQIECGRSFRETSGIVFKTMQSYNKKLIELKRCSIWQLLRWRFKTGG